MVCTGWASRSRIERPQCGGWEWLGPQGPGTQCSRRPLTSRDTEPHSLHQEHDRRMRSVNRSVLPQTSSFRYQIPPKERHLLAIVRDSSALRSFSGRVGARWRTKDFGLGASSPCRKPPRRFNTTPAASHTLRGQDAASLRWCQICVRNVRHVPGQNKRLVTGCLSLG